MDVQPILDELRRLAVRSPRDADLWDLAAPACAEFFREEEAEAFDPAAGETPHEAVIGDMTYRLTTMQADAYADAQDSDSPDVIRRMAQQVRAGARMSIRLQEAA